MGVPIFVSAGRTGNAANPLARRAPLALLAAYNLARRYRIDPRRVYVGGFSGGSRIALRLALGYPDVFHGALLDAGADPIGEADLPLPPRALFERFRTVSKLVFFNGSQDVEHREQQDASIASLHRWCVVNIATRSDVGLGHDIAPESDLAATLAELEKPIRLPSSKQDQCWSHVVASLERELGRAKAAVAAGNHQAARGLLYALDRRFAGLAAPLSVDIAARLDTARR